MADAEPYTEAIWRVRLAALEAIKAGAPLHLVQLEVAEAWAVNRRMQARRASEELHGTAAATRTSEVDDGA